ncbi:uncharacterized protein MONBRDRAFT_34115 [Monosiga brevicollis MX1]|uniref:non-specific serine/threonine protein kinase n=1 Tax=Monosiga brevicollis TaxID=81824 RepID=A9V9N6_MONBE|nr:uncharacterized protein MONBRDRAFT_34115 [Monosiga brevicollis MX1]EDQ85752.1 predicted protein [Monosiga brevicollis MX1]|eukprot:XP_001749467.1 hypothetical protein [Monosiga brevicollis MX1]
MAEPTKSRVAATQHEDQNQLIKQGAEARVFRGSLCGKSCIIKERFRKEYRHPTLDSKLTQKRTVQEGRALAKCRTLGISVPALYYVDITTSRLYIEDVDGETARDYLYQLDEAAPARMELAEQIGRAVGRLHANDLIHGDLTTSNMIRRPNAQLVMIDFGLSSITKMEEDKAVDLYVLERALDSTHPNSAPLFARILQAYRQNAGKQAKLVLKRLEDGLRDGKCEDRHDRGARASKTLIANAYVVASVSINLWSQLAGRKNGSMTEPVPSIHSNDLPPYIAIVSNTPLQPCHDALLRGAQGILALDGGANRLHQHDPQLKLTAIIGDFDSVLPATLDHYKRQDPPAAILHLQDQDSTDLQKALNFLQDTDRWSTVAQVDGLHRAAPATPAARWTVVVCGGLRGRLDHVLQSLNSGLMYVNTHRIVFRDQDCLAEVLPPGDHHLGLVRAVEGPHCGLLPLAGSARAVTHGLQWNLSDCDELEMRWGGLLSTSNRATGTHVRVTSSSALLWTIECT